MEKEWLEGSDFDDGDDPLPTALIATNVDLKVFNDVNEKSLFEEIFRSYSDEPDNILFAYLKSFRRVRIDFGNPMEAAQARIELHKKEINTSVMTLYFAQPPPSADDLAANPHLQPPPPFRQFLISPPCSPPVGWGQGLEASPVINYDLLAALTNMSPGEAHELHPAVDDKPSIVVHTCEDSENAVKTGSITQTTCPPRR